MKLKKLLCTLVAVGLTSAAFAGNTSELKKYIQNYFEQQRTLIEISGAEDTPEGITTLKTIQALENGLLAYEEQKTAQNLTGLNLEIDSLLTEFLTILNRIDSASKDVENESQPILQKLTEKIIENQSEIDKQSIHWEGAATLVYSFSFTNPVAEKILVVHAYKVLVREINEQTLKIQAAAWEEWIKAMEEEAKKEAEAKTKE